MHKAIIKACVIPIQKKIKHAESEMHKQLK